MARKVHDEILEIQAKIDALTAELAEALDRRIAGCPHRFAVCEAEYASERYCPECGLQEDVEAWYHTFRFKELRGSTLIRPSGDHLFSMRPEHWKRVHPHKVPVQGPISGTNPPLFVVDEHYTAR